MYCWSCGEYLPKSGVPCASCGAPPSALPRSVGAHPLRVRSCPGCGYTGDGIPYFRRAGHAALLVAATVFTYGLGGVAYWLIKRNDRICPSCGISWERARFGNGRGIEGTGSNEEREVATLAEPGRGISRALRGDSLPRGGMGRRVIGVLMALFAVLLLGIGIVEGEAAVAVISAAMGLGGAASFAWGWRGLQQRREMLLQRMQREVLHLARARDGRLTTTEVAAEMDLSLPAAERVLLSLDDGFRVRSEVTDDGLLVFDFPEVRYQKGENGGRRLNPGELA